MLELKPKKFKQWEVMSMIILNSWCVVSFYLNSHSVSKCWRQYFRTNAKVISWTIEMISIRNPILVHVWSLVSNEWRMASTVTKCPSNRSLHLHSCRYKMMPTFRPLMSNRINRLLWVFDEKKDGICCLLREKLLSTHDSRIFSRT